MKISGPILGGCADCRGLVTINSSTGAVTKNEDFYALAQASRFVKPGAIRVGSNSVSGSIETVAFQNPDSSLVLICVNASANTTHFSVQQGTKAFGYDLPSGGAVSFVWT